MGYYKTGNCHNGDIVKSGIYNRTFDLKRETWRGLVRRLYSKKWITERSSYIPIIEKLIEDRINKGRCTIQEVDELKEFYKNFTKNKKEKKENINIDIKP